MEKRFKYWKSALACLAAMAIITGCSSDDDTLPVAGGGLPAPANLTSWNGVSFQFNPTVSINAGQITFDDGFTFETDEGDIIEIDAGDSFPLVYENMGTFGNLVMIIAPGESLRFTLGQFQGTAESISSFTIGVYYNDIPLIDYQNLSGTVVEGTLVPGTNDPFNPEPIGELYQTVVSEVIEGPTGFGDLPEWQLGEQIQLQIPEDFSQLSIHDGEGTVTLELSADSGLSKNYFLQLMDNERSTIVSGTLWMNPGNEPYLLTLYLVETEFNYPYTAYQITYELDFVAAE